MKKQLTTTVGVAYANHGTDLLELVVYGEVFYTRKTKILKRLVRKVIHRVEIALDFLSVEEAKAEARKQLDDYVLSYYQETD